MTLDFTFNAIAEGDSPVTVSGYVFDSEGTVIAELSASSSVTVGGNLPPEPDEPDEPEEPEETTTTTTAIEETSVPEESKPIETTEAVTEAPEPDLTQPTEEAEPAEADVLTSSKSSSSSKAENERTDLAKKLTVPLLIILVTLIFALIIVTVWIKNRMKKK
jgi:cobalamin biosynthesis Mg chelatase CobN